MVISRKSFWILVLAAFAVVLITGIKPSAFFYEFGMWYLGFHVLVEFFTVAVAFVIGLYAFFFYQTTQRVRSLVLFITFLTSAIVDVLHALSYGGMPQTIIFPTVNTAIYFWLTARFIVAAGLLVSALVKPPAKSRFGAWGSVAIAFVIAMFVFLVVYYFTPQLPVMSEILSLTVGKIEVEFFLMFLFAATAFLYWRENKKSGTVPPYYLLLFLVFTIFSEFEFTLYPGAYYLHNLLGHVFKFAAYIFLLRHFAPHIKKIAELHSDLEI